MATTVDRTTAPAPRLGYQPSIDGLRAVSVVAVVLYHADVGWMPGGFLGVEVFFVVSGFLITSLLVEERHHSGAISLRQFWTRRGRRLLPALYLLLAVVSVASLLVYRDAAGRMGGDVLSAVFYVHNWWQIAQDQSYFAQAGRPPLLQHLWSLSIEEQFYLLFPPLLALALARFVRNRVVWVLVGLALASSVWMAILYEPFTDPSRVYYSTFTRASGLLLGAVLALVWAPWRTRGRAAPSAGPALNVAGVLGLALIAWFFTRVNAFDPFIYRGGFLLLDLVCLVVIAVLVHPAASIGRVLGLPPLVWLGQRSYAIYLWHWPIFMVTRPELDVPLTGWPLFVLRIGLTLGAAELSYRFVEQPMRHGALGDWWHRLRSSRGVERQFAVRRAATVGGVGLLLTVLIGWGLHAAASSPEREQLAVEAASALPGLEDGTTTTMSPEPGQAPPTTTSAEAAAVAGVSTPPATTATNAVAVGDSVLLGSKQQLKNAMPGITVDAEVARQFDTIVDVVRWYGSEGLMNGPLVVHAGTNGTFSDADVDRLFEIAGDRPVLLVNAKVERPWEGLVNQRLEAAAGRHSNAVLVDWYSVAARHPEWFAADGAHLRPEGARALAELVRSNL
jgi:peptidoglycan/LPS O-acetylase OafA/YrhL